MPNWIEMAEGSERLAQAQRVMIIGCSGGGKTTLALRLSSRLGLDYVSLDRDVLWLPGWQLREPAQRRAITERLVQEPSWIIDGTSASTFDLRLPRSDLLIWVRLPRWLCLWSVFTRAIRNFGQVRVAMPDDCPERVPDWEFLSYIWTFERNYSPRIIADIDAIRPDLPVLELRSREQVERFGQSVGA